MSTGAIIAIVIAAVIIIALLAMLASRARQRRLDTKRDEARTIRREAEVGRAQADRTRAEADERAARARREEAAAREQASKAEAQQRSARERHMEAAKVDPDVDEDEAADRYDRGDIDRGDAGRGATTTDDQGGKPGLKDRLLGRTGDQSVEHHEHTSTPEEERGRHFERDDEGNVVRDESYQEPRTRR